MTSQPVSSIRSQLLLVSACIVPAALVAAILITYDYRLARESFVHSAMATASANAMEVDKEFAMVQSALSALATSPSFTDGNLAAFHVQAEKLLEPQRIFNVVLSNATGQQLMNTVFPVGQRLPAQDDPLSGQKGDRDTLLVSNLYLGRQSRRHIVSVGVPVIDRRGERHILSAAVLAQRFDSLLQHQHYPQHWIATILDRNGTVIARSTAGSQYVGTPASPDLIARLRARPEGAFETAGVDGTPMLAVFAQAPDSDWTVAIGIPLHALSTKTIGKVWFLAVVTILLLGAGLLFAWKVGTRIRQAVRALIPPAVALGAGGQVHVAQYGLAEANEVGLALSHASAMLHAATHRANHDSLTGLANRAMLHAFLDHQVAVCQRMGAPLSVLCLDLDGFKQVNDIHGHAAGDTLLRLAAERLTTHLRRSDLAARLGGDEFAVVLVDSASSDAATVATMLEAVLAQPYAIAGEMLVAAASIGVATLPADGTEVASLLDAADQAMYQHKQARKCAPQQAPHPQLDR